MRKEFVRNTEVGGQCRVFVIDRSNLYNDVLDLFSRDSTIPLYPLSIRFKDERAIDLGGVCRDMFTAFWEEALAQHFDGSTHLTPLLTNMENFRILGTVLSRGYILEGFLPVRIAFPSLASMLCGRHWLTSLKKFFWTRYCQQYS